MKSLEIEDLTKLEYLNWFVCIVDLCCHKLSDEHRYIH